jgi:hypothetical protein
MLEHSIDVVHLVVGDVAIMDEISGESFFVALVENSGFVHVVPDIQVLGRFLVVVVFE